MCVNRAFLNCIAFAFCSAACLAQVRTIQPRGTTVPVSANLPAVATTKQSTGHVPVVEDLVQLLQARPDLRTALEGAIHTADLKGLNNSEELLGLLDHIVAEVPNQEEHHPPQEFKVFYIINHAPEDRLNRDPSFIAWMKKYMEARGHFMDTAASAAKISSFVTLPFWHIDDYIADPSGWMTFNQFFAREVKPGKRPIAEPCNDKVIVSPADSVFEGVWDIDGDGVAEIVVASLHETSTVGDTVYVIPPPEGRASVSSEAKLTIYGPPPTSSPSPSRSPKSIDVPMPEVGGGP